MDVTVKLMNKMPLKESELREASRLVAIYAAGLDALIDAEEWGDEVAQAATNVRIMAQTYLNALDDLQVQAN